MVYLWQKQREPLKTGIKEFCDMKKYVCSICGFVYDEEKGYPEEGIAPGTKWEDPPILSARSAASAKSSLKRNKERRVTI